MGVVEGYVYLLYSEKTGLYKLGMSVDPQRRLPEVEADVRGMNWRIVKTIPTADQRRLEKAFHRVFAGERVGKKEWFELTPEEEELFFAVAETVAPEAAQATPEPQARALPASVGPKLTAQWGSLMAELRRRKQALTAAVYSEARVESVEGRTVRLTYPAAQSFHVAMARDRGHLERLISVLAERLGGPVTVEIGTRAVSSEDIIRDERELFRLSEEWRRGDV